MFWSKSRETDMVNVGATEEAQTAPTHGLRGWVRDVYGQAYEDRREVRTYLEKAPENRPIERLRWLKRAFMVGGVVCSLYAILAEQAVNIILTRCFIAVAMLLWWDALRLVGRVLATESRGLIAVTLVAWAVCFTIKDEQLVYICVGMTIVSLALTFLLNGRWLGAETFYRTSRVKQALSELQSANIEELWESTGQKEVVAVAYDMGARVNDPVEIFVRKAVWVIGFLTAWKVNHEILTDLSIAKEESEAARKELAEADKALDDLADFIDDYAKYNQRMMALEDQVDELQAKYNRDIPRRGTGLVTVDNFMASERERLTQEVERLTAENEQLKRQANDIQAELNSYLEDPEAESVADNVVDIPDIDEILMKKFTEINPNTNDFCGIGKVASEVAGLGVKRWRVQKFKAEHADEIEAERRKIIERGA